MNARRWCLIVFALAALPLLCGAAGGATPAEWEATGLARSNLTALAVDNGDDAVLYAGDATGILYSSHDQGRTFQKAKISLHAPILAIAVDSAHPESVYVLT